VEQFAMPCATAASHHCQSLNNVRAAAKDSDEHRSAPLWLWRFCDFGAIHKYTYLAYVYHSYVV